MLFLFISATVAVLLLLAVVVEAITIVLPIGFDLAKTNGMLNATKKNDEKER